MVLPALRIDMFLKHAKATLPTTALSDTPVFELVTKKHGLKATARLIEGDFIVEAGSLARAKWEGAGTWDSGYAKLHEELRETGVLKLDGANCVFATNYAFSSPSAAAAVVYGRPASGPSAWWVKGTRQTYKEWEAAQLAQSEGDTA